MQRKSKLNLIKFVVAGTAYVPMLTIVFAVICGLSDENLVVKASLIFNFPALSVLRLIQTFHVSHSAEILSALAAMIIWSTLLAYVFWRAVGTMQGDDEPDCSKGQFDWERFQVRFVIGFVIGSLVGWRFVRNTSSMKTLAIASLVAGVIGGFIFGLSRLPDFWSRP